MNIHFRLYTMPPRSNISRLSASRRATEISDDITVVEPVVETPVVTFAEAIHSAVSDAAHVSLQDLEARLRFTDARLEELAMIVEDLTYRTDSLLSAQYIEDVDSELVDELANHEPVQAAEAAATPVEQSVAEGPVAATEEPEEPVVDEPTTVAANVEPVDDVPTVIAATVEPVDDEPTQVAAAEEPVAVEPVAVEPAAVVVTTEEPATADNSIRKSKKSTKRTVKLT
jgi:hypothetical protein